LKLRVATGRRGKAKSFAWGEMLARWFVWRLPLGRRVALWAAILGMSFFQVSPAAAAGLWVLKNAADVRTGPGLTFAVAAAAGRGTALQVTGQQGNWYQVQLSDGTTGWLAAHSVSTFAGPGTVATIAWPSVALFEGPGTGNAVTDWLRQGDEVRVLGQSGAWTLVTAVDGDAGWLPADLLAAGPGPDRAGAKPLPAALVVTGSSLSVRGGPGSGALLLTTAGRDDPLTVQGRFGDWYQVRTPDGLLGWVDGQFTRPEQLPASGGELMDGVAQTGVDLFAGPGTGFPVVAAATQGSYFTVLEQDGAWLKVKLAGDKEGWLAAALVRPAPAGADQGTSIVAGKGVWYEANDQITDTADITSRSFRDAAVTHIYLEAGTSTDGFPTAWQKQLDVLLPAAHRNHIKVILWVYVKLHDIAADAALTGRVANYVTPDGERPDGVAADIEELPANPQAALELVAGYATLTRPLLPRGLPLVAVTYPPQFEGNYPFAAMAADFDAVALMDYWHTTVNDYGSQGAAGLVRDSLVLFRGKAGRAEPVEVILQGFDGGTGLPDQREMLGALTAARAAEGYSVYTWRSMNGLLRQTFSRFR